MDLNENTRLSDIIAEYPWLPEALQTIDSRFRIISSPLGKLLIRTATLGDASKRAGYPVDTVVSELQKLIAAHEEAGS
ncbi:MAG: DUF1858 domain-containing protein [Clostridia bacterium]|nr:DUF1858 domain-containing protein [Clostridia bacterium]